MPLRGKKIEIDIALVSKLIANQFPQWKDLLICPVDSSGWDNKTFHLGDHMLIRLPSEADYELQVEKEQYWLPKLAPFLPLPIPVPLGQGKPDEGYPWKWSVYQWLKGESVASAKIEDLCDLAKDLGHFLTVFQSIDATNGPKPGLHSFYRGGSLANYDSEVREAIRVLNGKIDADATLNIWKTALTTIWHSPPVWVHGDVSAGNLLVQEGRLSAVIDFGQLAVGDPACDLAIAWTLFKDKSREIFRLALRLDSDTWNRGRAWTLWKALVVAAGFTNPNNAESKECWRIIAEVLKDSQVEG